MTPGCMLAQASMMTGNHNNDQLPVVMVGRGGGKWQTGRVLDYRNQPERQMCRLYLSMMQAMGIEQSSFGDATSPLAELRS